MTIRSRATFRFPRPNVGVDHPLWEQIRKYPEGFEIRAGETCEAPEWIKDDGMFALAQRDGNLIILDPPDPPEAYWTHPEGADKDPIIWRGFRGEFEMLHEKETASVRLARSNAPRLIAQCTYEGFDGLGSWALLRPERSIRQLRQFVP
jgi:hypothetical protein